MRISIHDIDLDNKQSVLAAYEQLKPALKKFGLLGDELKQNTKDDVDKDDYVRYVCRHRDGEAVIYQITDPITYKNRYVIAKNSKIKLSSGDMSASDKDLLFVRKRKKYISDGNIDENGLVLEDIDDNLTSMSLVAGVVLGKNSNGHKRLVRVEKK